MLYLLYFPDAATEQWVRRMVPDLHRCPHDVWVNTIAGMARYPVQMHLNSLDSETVVRCLIDLAQITYGPPLPQPINFLQWLLSLFGEGLCDLFMLPYNRKMWKRPLDQLAPSGFTGNIASPEFAEDIRGALQSNTGFAAYNVGGWYPRPPQGSVFRGMEVLARALGLYASDVRLGHTVDSVDLDTCTVHATHEGRHARFRFHRICVCTIPLPFLLLNCPQTPPDLRRDMQMLVHNRVRTATFSIRGPRSQGTDHWRYYADESLIFTRLIWMHEFDSLSAPADGWGLMAEIPAPGTPAVWR